MDQREPRFPVSAPIRVISLRLPADSVEARLIDISATGFRFQSRESLDEESVTGIEIDDRLILVRICRRESRGGNFAFGARRLKEIAKDEAPGDPAELVLKMAGTDSPPSISPVGDSEKSEPCASSSPDVEEAATGSGGFGPAIQTLKRPVPAPKPAVAAETKAVRSIHSFRPTPAAAAEAARWRRKASPLHDLFATHPRMAPLVSRGVASKPIPAPQTPSIPRAHMAFARLEAGWKLVIGLAWFTLLAGTATIFLALSPSFRAIREMPPAGSPAPRAAPAQVAPPDTQADPLRASRPQPVDAKSAFSRSPALQYVRLEGLGKTSATITIDGRPYFNGRLGAGVVRAFEFEKASTMAFSNGKNVRLLVNGYPVPLGEGQSKLELAAVPKRRY